MRCYIPDMLRFFAWMEEQSYPYVVLRGFDGFATNFPAHGAKEDVDLLVADEAIEAIEQRYGHYKRRQGVKCDIYSASGKGAGAYLDRMSYYPPLFAHAILSQPTRFHGRFYVPNPRNHWLSLLYHIAYHKAEVSKFHSTHPEASVASKYIPELAHLAQSLDEEIPSTLHGIDDYLNQQGILIPLDHLRIILQNDFAHHRKSLFLAELIHKRYQGEMNLFVLRDVARRAGKLEALQASLAEHYTILAHKDIPWLTRWKTRSKMRGGKWKRGGMPVRAVVVFDASPILTTAEDKKIHPYVFNAQQFVKRGWRENFAKETGINIKQNPLHSTDNEAEAWGHMNLFFTEEEQKNLLKACSNLRSGLTA